MNRRIFIKNILITGIMTQTPWFLACNSKNKIPIIKNEVLNNNQKNIILFILNKLFPENNNISIYKINTYNHINDFLLDPNADEDNKQYLIQGIKWVQETAVENHKNKFNRLSIERKNELFQYIINQDWGESWMSRLLTLIFESLLSDSIYNVNKNGIGWTWLHHIPGHPRPKINNSYKKLLDKKKKTEIISKYSQL